MNNTYKFEIRGKHLDQNIIDAALDNARSNVISDENVLQLLTNLKLKKLSILKMLYPIINEICECLYLNHRYAALTLTNYLFEAMAKMSLILYYGKDKVLVEKRNFEDAFKDEIEKFKNSNLHNNLELLCKIDLLSKVERDRLIDLKELYRNPFSHSSDNMYIKNASKKIAIGDLKDPEHKVEYKQIGVMSMPEFFVEAGLEFMKKWGVSYFCEIHSYLVLLDGRLCKLYNEIHE